MQLTINIDDDVLSKSVEEGIASLDKEEIGKMAREAIINYLSQDNNLNKLLFNQQTFDSYSGQYRTTDYGKPRDWFINILKPTFTAEDVEPYKEKVLAMVDDRKESIVVKALCEMFSSMLVTDQFKDSLRTAFTNLHTEVCNNK